MSTPTPALTGQPAGKNPCVPRCDSLNNQVKSIVGTTPFAMKLRRNPEICVGGIAATRQKEKALKSQLYQWFSGL